MPEDFRFNHRIKVRFRDIDMMGHVNNSVYLTYLEEARRHYFLNALKALPSMDSSFIVAGITINYRSPAHLGEELEVRLGVRELRTSSFVFEFRIVEPSSERIVSDGRVVQVTYDYGSGTKTEIPETYRKAFCEFEGIEECVP